MKDTCPNIRKGVTFNMARGKKRAGRKKKR